MNKKLSPDILVTRKKYNIIRKYPSPNEKQLPFPNISMRGNATEIYVPYGHFTTITHFVNDSYNHFG